MSGSGQLTGYGPRNRLIFDGDETGYELWETKFIAHLHLKDLAGVVDADADAQVDAKKNKEVYSE